MDFELSKEQTAVQKAAREFAKGEFDKDLALELEQKHEFPRDIWQKAGELGFIGMHYPESCSGADYGCLENVLVVEEFCRQDSSIGTAIMLCDFASETVLRCGTDEQKQRYLTPIAEGREIFGGAITEPDHGSDITTMATTAVRDGDEWVLNGVKTFITNGGIAHNYMVLCQTDADAGYRGQSMILVPGNADGLEIADVGLKMGIRLSPTGELTFKNVRVPAENLLGKEGRGFYQILEFFDESRVETAAQALGIAQGAFDRAVGPREEPQAVRQADRRVSGHPAQDRRDGDEARAGASRHLQGGVELRQGTHRSQAHVDGEVVRGPVGRRGRRRSHPDPGWLGLHDGLRGGALLPRREDHRDLRGDEGDPEEHDREGHHRQAEVMGRRRTKEFVYEAASVQNRPGSCSPHAWQPPRSFRPTTRTS